MKYTIEGFSQPALIEAGLDAIDAVILRWFVDFQNTGKMKQLHQEGRVYHWVQYQAVITDLPCIGIENKEALGRRFKKLVNAHVLKMVIHSVGGRFSYFSVDPEGYTALVDHSTQKSVALDSKVVYQSTQKSGQIDSSIIDPSIRSEEPPNPLEGGSARKRAPAVIDPLYHPIEQAFLSKGNFADYKKESVCIKAIVKKIRNLTPESPERTADKVLSTFLTLKSGNDKFWNQRPFLPSGLSPVLEQVWSVAQKTTSLSDVSYVERLRKEG